MSKDKEKRIPTCPECGTALKFEDFKEVIKTNLPEHEFLKLF